MDDTCLEDSLMQPADQTQTEAVAVLAEAQGDGADILKSSGALAALVKVQSTTYLLIVTYFTRFFSLNKRRGFHVFSCNNHLRANKN